MWRSYVAGPRQGLTALIDGQSLDLCEFKPERFQLGGVEVEFSLQPSIGNAPFDHQQSDHRMQDVTEIH